MTQDTTITTVSVYAVTLPFAEKPYSMSQGRTLTEIESTLIRFELAGGIVGWGEATTLGAAYLEGFAGSVRATVAEVADHVVGSDVMTWAQTSEEINRTVLGHWPGKAALEQAALDAQSRALNTTVVQLLGGHRQSRLPVFHPLSLGTPQELRDELTSVAGELGTRHWQVKVGKDIASDLDRVQQVLDAGPWPFVTVDVNGGWRFDEALRFASSLGGRSYYLEQPCSHSRDLRLLAQRTSTTIMADESVMSPADIPELASAGVAAFNLKPSRIGGLTRADTVRRLCEDIGRSVVIDEPMGGPIATAGVAALGAATSSRYLLAISHLVSFTAAPFAFTADWSFSDGHLVYRPRVGLGVEIDTPSLGSPIFERRATTP